MSKYTEIANAYLTDDFMERTTVLFIKETIDEKFNYDKWSEFIRKKFLKSKLIKIIEDLDYPTINFKEFRTAINERLKIWADREGYSEDSPCESSQSVADAFAQILKEEFS